MGSRIEGESGAITHLPLQPAALCLCPALWFVHTTHLTNGDPQVNAGQAASLAAFVAYSGEGSALLGGDLNAEEVEPQIWSPGWVDTYRQANPDDLGFTCCVTDLTSSGVVDLNKRIDHIFLLLAGRAEVVSSRRVLDEPFQTETG
jgi:hypothetical protein